MITFQAARGSQPAPVIVGPAPGSQAANGAPAHQPDSVILDDGRAAAMARCKKAIGRLTGGIGLVGLGVTGAFAGASFGSVVLGAAVGGALGLTLGVIGGRWLAGKLHGKDPALQPLTNWQEPARTSPQEAARMRAGIRDLQTKIHAAGKVDDISRGFHMKQDWGGKVHVEFRPDMPEELRKEILQNVAGTTVDTALRFSNGQGCPLKDLRPDVRGAAIKMNIGGQEADMLFTNHVTFARNAEQFMRFAEISAIMQTKGPASALGAIASKIWHRQFKFGETLRIMKDIVRDTTKRTQHLAAETYWTQAMHVGNWTGRFVLIPESGADARFPRKGAPENYLRDGVEQDLEKGPIRMKLAFEAFTKAEAANDASQHGTHVTYDVGTLIIDQRARNSAERQFEEHTVSNMQFNPTHGFRLTSPINESNRGEIYHESAEYRGAHDWNDADVRQFFGR
jgi:hypothetical protein